jgi:hypothetical protein
MNVLYLLFKCLFKKHGLRRAHLMIIIFYLIPIEIYHEITLEWDTTKSIYHIIHPSFHVIIDYMQDEYSIDMKDEHGYWDSHTFHNIIDLLNLLRGEFGDKYFTFMI